MKVRKGDKVRVLTGKDRGREGTVIRVFPKTGKVIVEDINVAKRHTKPRQSGTPGGIIDKPMPIDASNVAVLDRDGNPTRVKYRFDAEGKKIRVSRKGDDL